MTEREPKKPGRAVNLLQYVFGPPSPIEKEIAKEKAAQEAIDEIERHRLHSFLMP